MKSFIKKVFKYFGIEIKRIPPDDSGELYKVISLETKNNFRGDMLLSYINKPFLLKEGESFPNSHTNYWECWQIANTFLDLGYNVDVVHSYNDKFVPTKKYDIFIGHRNQYERIAKMMGADCLKIAHLDTAHWVYNNYATYKRSLDLQQRRGATIYRWSQVIIEYNLAIECADFATIMGNDFSVSTYKYANKPIFRIPISTCDMYPWPETKNFEKCRKNYLWFGSHGMVHKGLDLVLETFKDMPEYNLTICGPVEKESYFVTAYYKELYQSPNIHTIGWINTNSVDFVNILNNCIGLIYPSCSEGASGGVVTCMHGGLIPIVSYESGVDVTEEYGILLKYSSVAEIKASIKMISDLPADQLKRMAQTSWEFARKNHTRDRFNVEYRKAIENILKLNTYGEKISV